MKKVKITVLQRNYYENNEGFIAECNDVGPCPLLKEGDIFIYEGNGAMPDGFCSFAWNDIHKEVISADSNKILCCTDGMRPVVFSAEVFDE